MGAGLVVIPALWVCFWNRSHAESPASLLGTLQSMQKIKQIPPPNLSQTTVRKIPDVALAYSVAFCGGARTTDHAGIHQEQHQGNRTLSVPARRVAGRPKSVARARAGLFGLEATRGCAGKGNV